jgi:transketolase
MVNTALSIPEMEATARKIRRHILNMIGKANSGHPGGSLSAVELLVALYFQVLKHDPKNPKWPERDRFILSKGHGAPVLYAVLAECGYVSIDQLLTLRQMDSCFQGHTDCHLTPGVEMSAGSLGQGLSFAVGTALAGKLDALSYKVFALLGDGECDEGQVWEAAMAAAHFKADNLIAIIDKNEIQLDGWTKDIMNNEPFADKWRGFGWRVFEVDGHNVGKVAEVLENAKQVTGQPAVIIAHTVKGKGVSFMENNPDFHGKAPTPAELEKALKEVG